MRVVVPAVLRSPPAIGILLVLGPTIFYVLAAVNALEGVKRGSDFASFWHGGRAVLHGLSPYPTIASLPEVANRITFVPFVYPPPAAFALGPLSVLPFAVADTLFFLLILGSVALALRALDVTDWRCYAATYAALPIMAAVAVGSLSTLLLLGVALAWRYRQTTWRLGALVAVLVVAKLFLWPLWVWLVYTRRYRAAIVSAVAGAVSTFGAWAAIHFAGLHDYPQLLSRMSELVGTKSYSPYALARAAGATASASQLLVLLAGVVVVASAVRWLPSVRTDQGAFLLAVGIGLFLTPILWPHYLVLAFIPVALARKTMSAIWLCPLLFWFDGAGWSYGHPIQIAPFLCISAVPFVLALRAPR
jgi:alpha-1,2-mannosyltransferase